MANKKSTKWDVKRGYSVYKDISTNAIKKWIRERRFSKGEEVFLWRSGMSGWRRPAELDEFKGLFKKKKK